MSASSVLDDEWWWLYKHPHTIPHPALWFFPLQEYELFEFFAGNGNLSRCSRATGLKTASFDILYTGAQKASHGSNCMDINSPSGFAPLVWNYVGGFVACRTFPNVRWKPFLVWCFGMWSHFRFIIYIIVKQDLKRIFSRNGSPFLQLHVMNLMNQFPFWGSIEWSEVGYLCIWSWNGFFTAICWNLTCCIVA